MTEKKEASQHAGNQFFQKVFHWIVIKGGVFIIADTTASLRKEHIHTYVEFGKKRGKISLREGGKIC